MVHPLQPRRHPSAVGLEDHHLQLGVALEDAALDHGRRRPLGLIRLQGRLPEQALGVAEIGVVDERPVPGEADVQPERNPQFHAGPIEGVEGWRTGRQVVGVVGADHGPPTSPADRPPDLLGRPGRVDERGEGDRQQPAPSHGAPLDEPVVVGTCHGQGQVLVLGEPVDVEHQGGVEDGHVDALLVEEAQIGGRRVPAQCLEPGMDRTHAPRPVGAGHRAQPVGPAVDGDVSEPVGRRRHRDPPPLAGFQPVEEVGGLHHVTVDVDHRREVGRRRVGRAGLVHRGWGSTSLRRGSPAR